MYRRKDISLNLKTALVILFRTLISLLGGGIFHSTWLAAFLLASKLNCSALKISLRLLSPVITAAGFTAGLAILDYLGKKSKAGFFKIYLWPLTGCAAGVVAVYWYGPMLTVFTMLAAGAASIALREVLLALKKKTPITG